MISYTCVTTVKCHLCIEFTNLFFISTTEELIFLQQAFGHDSFDPRHGHTTENLHQTFLKTLQGEALPSLIETIAGHLQDVMLRPDTLSSKENQWQVDGIFAFCYKVST